MDPVIISFVRAIKCPQFIERYLAKQRKLWLPAPDALIEVQPKWLGETA